MDEHAATEPIRVKHVPGTVETEVFQGVSHAFSPDISVLQTVTLPASSLVPVLVLPRDPRRFKATLLNSGATGVAIVGSRGQVSNAVGGQIPVNGRLEIYSGAAYYAVAQGSTAAQLTVLIETFSQGEPEAA